MASRVLTIEERRLQVPGQLASLADFTYLEGEKIDPKVVRDNPYVSPYCFDDATRRAVFVELPPSVDLTKAAFVYTTQGEQAKRLIAVSYDDFVRLASELPKVENLIPIYISGRSGSTLLSHIFNKLDTVMSLSEPDAATQFAYLRDPDGSRDKELCKLIDSTVRFFFKPNRRKQASTYALKFRAEAVSVMDLYQVTFPHAKNLFSYRDAVGWVTSFYRLFKNWGYEDQQSLSVWLPLFEQAYKKDAGDLKAYLGEGDAELPLTKVFTLWWLFAMEAFLTQYERGIPVLAVRYDDLNTHREKVVSEIFAYCGLPVSGVKGALRAFEQDAQAGTRLAREDGKRGNKLRLSEQQLADIHDVLQRHPVIKTPDFRLPGTLEI